MGLDSPVISSQSSTESTLTLGFGDETQDQLVSVDEDIIQFFSYLNGLLHKLDDNGDEIQRELRKSVEELIQRTRATVLRLNLSKNLLNFHNKTTQEQSDMERTIMTKNMETFQKNLSMLELRNEALHSKNMELMKKYRQLKDTKRGLKMQNSQQRKEIEQLRSILAQQGVENPGQKKLLNTLGLLASHVLEDEK